MLVGICITLGLLAARSYFTVEFSSVTQSIQSVINMIASFVQLAFAQAFVIWLALRHPILGQHPLRTGMVAIGFITVSAYAEYGFFVSQDIYFGSVSKRALFQFFVFFKAGSMILQVAGFVLIRRCFGIILVAETDDLPRLRSRFSIAEMMLWTFVAAIYLAIRRHLEWMVSQSGGAVVVGSWWHYLFGSVIAVALPAVCFLILFRMKRHALWKRGIVLFAICLIINAIRTISFYLNPESNWSFIDWNSLLASVILTTLAGVMHLVIAIWLLRRLHYQFQQIGDKERPSNGLGLPLG